MNLQEAIAAAQSMPHVFTVTKRDLGPRLGVELVLLAENRAHLTIKYRLEKLPAVGAVLSVHHGRVRISTTQGGLPAAMLVLEHVRSVAGEGVGPIQAVKDHERSAKLRTAAQVTTKDLVTGKVIHETRYSDSLDDEGGGVAIAFALDGSVTTTERKARREARVAKIREQRGDKTERRPKATPSPAPSPEPAKP